jgi:t-SNARE complex subunit (syntaxin)
MTLWLQLGSDSADAVAALFHAVATGQISPSEGAAATALLEAHARTQSFAELEKRMERIEQILEKSA